VEIQLKNFFVSPDDVPEDVQKNVLDWSEWIDYWAIDWDYREDAFHNQWQSYRTKKTPTLQLKASHQYDHSGIFTIIVKVIDIFGNDTTRALKVKVQYLTDSVQKEQIRSESSAH